MLSAIETIEEPAAVVVTSEVVVEAVCVEAVCVAVARTSVRDAAWVVSSVVVSTAVSVVVSGVGASAVASTVSLAAHAMSGTVTVVGSVETCVLPMAVSEDPTTVTGAAEAAEVTAAVSAKPVMETTAVPRTGVLEMVAAARSLIGASGRRALRCRGAVLAYVTSGAISLLNLRGQLSDSGRRARPGLPDFTPRPSGPCVVPPCWTGCSPIRHGPASVMTSGRLRSNRKTD